MSCSCNYTFCEDLNERTKNMIKRLIRFMIKLMKRVQNIIGDVIN